MSTILQDILSCCDHAAPTSSRSRSRGSGQDAPRRSRSGQSSRHDDTRHPRVSRYRGHSRGKHRPEGTSYSHTPSPQNTGETQGGVQTNLVHRNHHTRPQQSERDPPRRSTFPSNLESTKVHLPKRRHTGPRSGFDPLANKDAYEGLDFFKDQKDRRTKDREQRSSGRQVNPTQTPPWISEAVPDRDYWIDVRADAVSKPFEKLDDEFWDTQLTKEEQSAAIEMFENDFESAYAVNLYPYLEGVIPSLSGAQLTEVVKVKWTSIDAFRRRIHPHLVRSIPVWKQILEEVTDGDKNIGRYLAANHTTDHQLSQAQQACDTAGRPFWQMAALEHKQELRSRVEHMLNGRRHDSARDRESREEQLIKALQCEFRTELDPPDTCKSGPTM